MRLTIFTKLFLAILVSMLTMVVIMAVFVNLSFRNGFADYLHRGEINKVKELSSLLSKEYSSHGDWGFIRQSPHEWTRLILQIRGIPPPRLRPPPPRRGASRKGHPKNGDPFGGRRPPPPFGEWGRPPPRPPPLIGDRHPPRPPPFNGDNRLPPNLGAFPPPPRPAPLGERIRLLDVTKEVVVGGQFQSTPKSFTTNVKILSGDSIIGWIEVKQGTSIVDGLAEKFLDQQFRNFYLIAVLVMLIAILSSVFLARNFVRPINALSKGVKKLSDGNLESRLSVSSNDELGELAHSFNKLALTLEKNDTQRKQWLVDISHELRTPIAILRSEIEAMLDGIREANTQRIRSLHTDILSLGQLVDDLYQLSLSDSDEMVDYSTRIDLVNVVAVAVETIDSLLKKKEISLTFIDTKKSIFINGNERSLHQLISNILANSFRYTDVKGCIEVEVKNYNQMAEIVIQDSTPGVPEESLPFLFDRLYRVDKSRNRALGGSGLGLSICKIIVKAHQGNIIAEHSPLGGLLIRIQFPWCK